ncbi:MAG: hypothetical protein GON13_03255 [Nanoarchaeota archaeon]|nr:hypothetical protein [Nanoarchaeota archaeon]
MRKGFVLSTDLLAGIVISIIFISLIVFRAGVIDSSSKEVLRSVEASDALIVLHKTGVLASENESYIKSEIDKFSSNYYVSINYFDENLTNYLNISFGEVLSNYVFAKRPFYSYNNKSIIGVAELRLK